ncbi:putative membrane protein [Natronospira proteinivora]|uniref:Membrane protein n=1 Tax=Natronospira proteinivora TaxID=1807133 RepID=A0ABT1G7K3_9GAMM|nr:alpha/beta-hydrolase family protein [Natronospira proteinivora]MCP1727201.1 putative membrane protein [Natronospira proteinivora]
MLKRRLYSVYSGIRNQFSIVGLLLGTFFFALSLTPSLLPRVDIIQGIISGFSLAAGYGLGVLSVGLWGYLQLPSPPNRVQYVLKGIAAASCIILAVIFLWRADAWQNDLRSLMEMEATTGVRSLVVALVALVVFSLLLLIARLFRNLFFFLSGKLSAYVPPRISHLMGLLAAFALFWAIVDGILFSFALRSADTTHQQIDALMEAELDRPLDPRRSGSDASLLNWEEMGRQGRRFLATGPSQSDIAAFSEGDAREPIRVYVGLNAANTPEERAELALAELKRVDAFSREMLILITPTGTGWVDPAGINPIEYLQRGNVASVAAQYSYLPSPISLMAEGAYGAESARALFQSVYGHWRSLPRQERPRLYLFGLSLGALNSDRSFDFYDIIDDPFHGALWSGPPFRSDTWRDATERRRPDSPAWLPRFRDDSVIRFANQDGGLDTGMAPWGDFRLAYLQYASDPITFFDPASLLREPDWLKTPRGPDVSEHLRWFPVVTMLQLAADMAAGSSPRGYGHEYAPAHYLQAWLALTEPDDWSHAELQRLQERLNSE